MVFVQYTNHTSSILSYSLQAYSYYRLTNSWALQYLDHTLSILTKLLLPASSSSICSDTVIPSSCGKLTLVSSAMLRFVRLVIRVYQFTLSGDDRKNVTLKFVVGVMSAEQAIICDQSSVWPNVVQLYKRASRNTVKAEQERTGKHKNSMVNA